jgi:outer membrane biosynthesis protein TonB
MGPLAQVAGIAARVTGAVGGAPILAGLIVGGLVLGSLAGGLAGRASRPGESTSVLDIYPCWKAGTPFAKAPPGQEVWITGRNADGTWFRIYTASPTLPEGWALASLITVDQPAEVPVVDCAPIEALMVLESPGETLTAVQNNSPSPAPFPTPTPTPTPKATPTATPTRTPTRTQAPTPGPTSTPRITPRPTRPPPTPTPTPTHETEPPVIVAIRANPDVIMRPRQACQLPTESLVLALISDESVVTATLHYAPPGLGEQAPIPMAGPTQAGGGSYTATLRASLNWPNSGSLSFYVVAVDEYGNGPIRMTGTIAVEC